MAATVSFIFRILIGGVFLIAGLAKISDPVRFLFTLREFQLVPGMIERFLAVYLPWLEFILGLFIILGLLHRTSSLILACLNTVFTLAILSVIIRGIEVDCGCFGLLADILKLPDMADMKAVIRNIIFIGMCLYIFFAKRTLLSLDNYRQWNRSV
ncbi:MAG: MauE/DoxX family redox-associated membrane protein [Thermodesulfovibrionales bacterium]|nr:DoxX family membrane protein [Nitrospinota bacterium]MCG2709078.1 DoxX family membrane protein [Thermodesulfovibrionales bacterium]MDP3049454.1 MauE/DoxX family redox-associated membrane protein [Thermodesulfovibrionales bacterium]